MSKLKPTPQELAARRQGECDAELARPFCPYIHKASRRAWEEAFRMRWDELYPDHPAPPILRREI